MDAPTGALELENTNNDLRFVDTDYSSSDTDPFDDMLIALDPDDILRPLAKEGSIPSALAVTMDRLNLIRQVLVARIVNDPDPQHEIPSGPVLPIPPIPSSPAGRPLDGWGMPFEYAQGTVGSKVCGAPPPAAPPPPSASLTTFKLTSLGVDQKEWPDTNTGQNDDIVVSQNNDHVKLIIQSQGKPCQ